MASKIKTCGVQTPGPAGYALPTLLGTNKHDVRRKMLPAYSFGTRMNSNANTIGTGPGAINLGKVSRYGRVTNIEYSLGKRLDFKDKDMKPGPAHYNLMNMPRFKEAKPPEYSMAARLDRTINDGHPGPNVYKVGLNDKRTNPIYSMGARLDMKRKNETPGPNNYNIGSMNITNRRAPEYFLGIKTNLPGSKTQTPAPNNYALQNHRPGDTQPIYSFGSYHSPCAPPMIIPGDNC